jgi:LysM repeat protein
LNRQATPPRDFALKVPAGAGEAVESCLQAFTEDERLRLHVVKRGETLLTIARKFKVSRAELADANNLKMKSAVRAGQDLIIPRAPATLLAALPERTAPDAVASRSLVASAAAPAVAHPEEFTQITYRVKRGDTLSSIAELFDTTVAKIKSWNRLTSNRIPAGARLKILTTRTN